MTKSIMLAAAMALTLASGAAMADGSEGDAQNLFNGYNGFRNVTVQTVRPGQVSYAMPQNTEVQSGSSDVYIAPNTVAPAGGGDGGAN